MSIHIKGLLIYHEKKADTLESKVKAAAERYQSRTGKKPMICAVHPSMVGETLPDVGLELVTSTSVQTNHLLIGVVTQ